MCFVHTPCPELQDDRLEPPLGILYLATLVRRGGGRVRVTDLASASGPELEGRIPGGFDVYAFSTYSVSYGATRRLAAAVRRRQPGALLLAGGPHATALPREVAVDGFDAVITGEGEETLLALLDALGRGRRPRGVFAGIPPRPLDDLPFPDRSLVDLGTYSRQVNGHRSASVLSSRGCPYPCSFCNSRIMGGGTAVRLRSAANVAAEIRQLRERHGIRHVRFQDDLFTLNLRRMRQLAPALAAEGVEYRCFARVNTLGPEMADLLRASGCVHVSFGVESGSRRILAPHAMNKRQTPAQIRTALESAHGAGLRTRIFLMVGFPGETEETIAETLALVKSCPWEEFSVYPLIAYPGTPLHDHPERYGITHIRRDYGDYLQIGRDFRAGFTLRTATFDEEQVRRWRDRVIRELLADGRTWAGSSKGFT